MFKTLRNALKIEDIRKKLIFTFFMLIVVRFGSQLPIPGVNRSYFQQWFAQQTGDAFNFFDAFTGGSFTSMSLFALGITPYITSSIIVQLLTIAIPKLEEMQKENTDHFPLSDRCLGADRRYCHDDRIRWKRIAGICDDSEYDCCRGCHDSRKCFPYVDR